jgi:hypothetical protein
MAINGFTNIVGPDMRRVNLMSPHPPLSAAAIWPLTMLGRCLMRIILRCSPPWCASGTTSSDGMRSRLARARLKRPLGVLIVHSGHGRAPGPLPRNIFRGGACTDRVLTGFQSRDTLMAVRNVNVNRPHLSLPSPPFAGRYARSRMTGVRL